MSLYQLNREILSPDSVEHPHLIEMCGFADSIFDEYGKAPEGTFAFVGTPRETRKTTNIVIGGAIKFLIEHRNASVLIDSHVHKLAQERLTAIKSHLEFNKRFRDEYGDWRTDALEWNESAIRIADRGGEYISAEPSIDTSGRDKSKTGGHYDLILPDDLVNEEDRNSATIRRKTIEHIQTLYPLLKTGGIMLFVGTFWHYADAYMWLIKTDQRERKRAEEQGVRPHAPLRTYIRGAFNKDGSLYAPTLLPYEKLDWLRNHIAPSLFAPNYLLVPTEEKDKTFPSSWLQYFEAEFFTGSEGQFLEFPDGHRVPVFTYFLWDPAGYKGEMLTQDESSDHGMCVVAVAPDDTWYVLHAEAVRGKASDVVSRAVYLTFEYRPRMVKGEWVGSNEQWQVLYMETLRRRGLIVPGMEFARTVPTKQKDVRIELALEPRYRRRAIFFRAGVSEAVTDQLDQFPKGAKKDILDALEDGEDEPRIRGPQGQELEPTVPRDPDDEDDTAAATNAAIIQRAGAWVGTGTPVPRNSFVQKEPGWQPSQDGDGLRKALRRLGRAPSIRP